MSEWETPGESDEWYTPREVFDALGCRFDLDVAAPVDRKHVSVPASRFFTENALAAEWCGFVWMNPPFGGRDGLRPWLRKFFAHGNGIALTPDRTSASWFQEAWPLADAVLFTRKLRFIRPDGSVPVSPPSGSALWAVGGRAVGALERAASDGFGVVTSPGRDRERLVAHV